MKYISIDGDDIGRQITSFYLSNNSAALRKLSLSMKFSTEAISNLLVDAGFSVLFCAADGVTAEIESSADFGKIFVKIRDLAPTGITYSAGVGDNLREAYIALTSAKSNGKNCLHYYANIEKNNLGFSNV